jgi:hypothetical protein
MSTSPMLTAAFCRLYTPTAPLSPTKRAPRSARLRPNTSGFANAEPPHARFSSVPLATATEEHEQHDTHADATTTVYGEAHGVEDGDLLLLSGEAGPDVQRLRRASQAQAGQRYTQV